MLTFFVCSLKEPRALRLPRFVGSGADAEAVSSIEASAGPSESDMTSSSSSALVASSFDELCGAVLTPSIDALDSLLLSSSTSRSLDTRYGDDGASPCVSGPTLV